MRIKPGKGSAPEHNLHFPFLPGTLSAGTSGLGSVSSIQAAVRQLEAEADAIIQMVREGQRARRQQQATTVSMMPVALVGHSFCLFQLPFSSPPPHSFPFLFFPLPSFLLSLFNAYLVCHQSLFVRCVCGGVSIGALGA